MTRRQGTRSLLRRWTMAGGRWRQTFGFDTNVRKISEGTARERTNSITISGNCPNVTARAHQARPSPKPIWPKAPRGLNPVAAREERWMVAAALGFALPAHGKRHGGPNHFSFTLFTQCLPYLRNHVATKSPWRARAFPHYPWTYCNFLIYQLYFFFLIYFEFVKISLLWIWAKVIS
jgi:hypothetical protein